MVQHDSRVRVDMEDIDDTRGQRRAGTVRYRNRMAPSRENPAQYMSGEVQPRRRQEEYGEAPVPQRNPVRNGSGTAQPRRRQEQCEEMQSRKRLVQYGEEAVNLQENPVRYRNGSAGQNPYLEDYAMQRVQGRNRQRTRTARELSYIDTNSANRGRVSPAGKGRKSTVQVVRGRTSADMAARRAAQYRRRKRILLQRIAIVLWVLFIGVMTIFFLDRHDRAVAGDRRSNGVQAGAGAGQTGNGRQLSSSDLVQGIPADIFAKHPDWTENLLTPNEYSRPGDPLESVTNIFVHYTANAGTSAAQNRSYFEQQKDSHQNSVSAHFIIGYEGEILQCVPLDEIAYAVKSRNFDSISIECCFLEEDGSFTQATYDSLISLLAWLIDVYDLDSEDILRHYDCGGKKCPLYYTEHPEAWTQLKKDVDKL